MAKRHRHARSSPRGGGFLRGLALGLAIALGVQVHHAGLPDWLASDPEEPAAKDPIEPSNTNFDFYRLLPKSEVRIDESDLPGERAPAAPQTASRPPAPQTAPRPSAPQTASRPSPPTSQPPAASSPGGGGFRVQVGAFRDRQEAERLRASLALNGFESRIRIRNTAQGTWHRVVLGPFRLREAAEEAKARVLASRGIDAQIVREES